MSQSKGLDENVTRRACDQRTWGTTITKKLKEPRELIHLNDFKIEAILRTHVTALLRGCEVSREILWLFDTGGKRLRPRFVLALIKDLLNSASLQSNLSGESTSSGVEVAAAVELLHIASLVHDDLPCLDDASERRGHPAAHIKFGQARALLIGDLLPMLAAISIAGALWIPSQIRIDILFKLAQAYQKLCEGQMQELLSNTTSDEFIKVAGNKTGALFSFTLEAAALIAGSDSKTVAIFRDLGLHIGIYFQGLDDLADGDAIIHTGVMDDLRKRILAGLNDAEKLSGCALPMLRAIVKEAIAL